MNNLTTKQALVLVGIILALISYFGLPTAPLGIICVGIAVVMP